MSARPRRIGQRIGQSVERARDPGDEAALAWRNSSEHSEGEAAPVCRTGLPEIQQIPGE